MSRERSCTITEYSRSLPQVPQNTALTHQFPGQRKLLRKSNSQSDCKSSFQVESPDFAHKKRRRKHKRIMEADLSGTKFNSLYEACEKAGFTTSQETGPNCFLIWHDVFVTPERITDMKPFQKANHFPGMMEICRKDLLAKNMQKMNKVLPDEFDFVPKTWSMPREYEQLVTYQRDHAKSFGGKAHRYFIAKPAGGAQGHGISLTRTPEKFAQFDNYIVQEYLDKPFTIDGFKFDLRVYALVIACDPLRAFLYTDGLVRLATEKYTQPNDENIDCLYMHLTNYSVNKKSTNYEKGSHSWAGSKRSIRDLMDYLRRNDFDVVLLWKRITDVIVKTLLLAQPYLYQNYKVYRPAASPVADSVCFELLGFDIFLDEKLKPWVIEVNRSPSFGTESALDKEVKQRLLADTFQLINIRPSDRNRTTNWEKSRSLNRLLKPTRPLDAGDSLSNKRLEEMKLQLYKLKRESNREDFENRNAGLYRRIFPVDERFTNHKYGRMLLKIFDVVMGANKSPSLQAELESQYVRKVSEDAIAEKLRRRGLAEEELEFEFPEFDESEEDDEEEEEDSVGSDESHDSGISLPRSTTYCSLAKLNTQTTRDTKEEDDWLIRRTLEKLRETNVKYPGKNDDETASIVADIYTDWKVYKPQIASYWLVKLDSAKRRKVLEIVRHTIEQLIRDVFEAEPSQTSLGRVITRLYNRLLWNNGQGLWNSFTSSNSWEVVFTYSTFSVTSLQLECCRRVVQMCRDCVIIVFKFSQARRQQPTISASRPPAPSERYVQDGRALRAVSTRRLA